jgi:glucose-6-phosphate 1-epimerase
MSSETIHLNNNSIRGENASFDDTLAGLPCMTFAGGDSRIAVARQGAQVLSWRDAKGRERLYLSPQTGGDKRGELRDDATLPQAIRGGVPVCFPQFSGRGPLLKHGFARSVAWTLESLSTDAARSIALFTLRDDERTHAIWPHAFLAQLSVAVEPRRLIMTLTLTNNGDAPWSFTGALHTYLRVNDIARTELAGLQHTHYQDATADNVEMIERESSIKIGAELDRVYLSPPASLQLLEDGKPSLCIEHAGFTDTVVWNPGPILARNFKDFPDDDWRHMLCVEAACAAKPVVIPSGKTWIGSQTLTVA